MKSLDKLPTPQNLDEAAQNDILDRNKFIANFIRLLASIEGHYSIALDGRWGSGKTFFIKQTERVIRQLFRYKKDFNICYTVKANTALCNQFKELFEMDEIKTHPMMTLYYDAWQHDNQQDPLLSLVFETVKLLPTNDPRLKAKLSKRDKFQKSIVPITQGIINHLVGLDFKSIKNEFDDQESDILLKIRNQETLDSLLNDFFKNILQNDNTRLVIFIDELDRCKPDYAVQLLERIKHYITFDRIIFVFSVNIDQLQHTIKRYYGNDFDASSYLDRFFDLHVGLSVPKIGVSMWGSLDSEIFVPWCRFLASKMKFDLRKQGHFYELVEQSLHISSDVIFTKPIIPESILSYFNSEVDIKIINKYNIHEKIKFTFTFLECFFVPLVFALRMNNISDYYSFIDGEDEEPLKLIIDYLNQYNNEQIIKPGPPPICMITNTLVLKICDLLSLSNSYKNILCKDKNYENMVKILYRFIFTTEYDGYDIKSGVYFTSGNTLILNYHIKNEISGLFSFTSRSHRYIR